MNKRWNNRKPISIGLVVNYPALGLLRGRATNISSDGMFIETAATSLCQYSEVEVTMNLPKLSDTPVQIRATIIHNNKNGIGIMFNHNNEINKSSFFSGLDVLHQLLAKPDTIYKHAS